LPRTDPPETGDCPPVSALSAIYVSCVVVIAPTAASAVQRLEQEDKYFWILIRCREVHGAAAVWPPLRNGQRRRRPVRRGRGRGTSVPPPTARCNGVPASLLQAWRVPNRTAALGVASSSAPPSSNIVTSSFNAPSSWSSSKLTSRCRIVSPLSLAAG
jgi:hypothetical protein